MASKHTYVCFWAHTRSKYLWINLTYRQCPQWCQLFPSLISEALSSTSMRPEQLAGKHKIDFTRLLASTNWSFFHQFTQRRTFSGVFCFVLVEGSGQHGSYAYRGQARYWFWVASDFMRFWICPEFSGSFYMANFPALRNVCFWFLCPLPRDKRQGNFISRKLILSPTRNQLARQHPCSRW